MERAERFGERLGKSCSFGLARVPFVNCGQFMYLVFSLFGFEGRMWDLIVSEHCLSFYFSSAVRYNPDAESRIFRIRFIHIKVYVRDDQIAM